MMTQLLRLNKYKLKKKNKRPKQVLQEEKAHHLKMLLDKFPTWLSMLCLRRLNTKLWLNKKNLIEKFLKSSKTEKDLKKSKPKMNAWNETTEKLLRQPEEDYNSLEILAWLMT